MIHRVNSEGFADAPSRQGGGTSKSRYIVGSPTDCQPFLALKFAICGEREHPASFADLAIPSQLRKAPRFGTYMYRVRCRQVPHLGHIPPPFFAEVTIRDVARREPAGGDAQFCV